MFICAAHIIDYRSYRLGPYGLLTSAELRNAGYLPNNALRDQKLGLLWIQKYAAGFGGDPARVTVAGESAGAVSCHYHLQSTTPLFKRVIMMSGTDLLFPAISLDQAERNYETFVKHLELSGATPEARLEVLRTMNGLKLAELFTSSGVPALPVLDQDIISLMPSFAAAHANEQELPGLRWCESFMLGNCQFDGNIFDYHMRNESGDLQSKLYSVLENHLRPFPGLLHNVANHYKLDDQYQEGTGHISVLHFANDLNFACPVHYTSSNLESESTQLFVYRFNEPNPWDGTWKGHAVHIQDLVWLLQNFNEFLEDPQRRQAEHFAKDIISFAFGTTCWAPWTRSTMSVKEFGPQGQSRTISDATVGNGQKATFLIDLQAKHCDALKAAFDELLYTLE